MRVVHSTSWKFQTEALAGILTAPKGCLWSAPCNETSGFSGGPLGVPCGL